MSIEGHRMNDSPVAPQASPGREYLERAAALVQRLLDDEWSAIDAAATAIATSLAAGGTVHAFGTGHSHMLAEELFYRAGGLVRVRPILFEGLMLHGSAPLSTALERLPGLAAALVADHGVDRGDVVIVVSNSGGNAVTAELVAAVHERGATVIAVTSVAHATSPWRRASASAPLHETADIVIDNGGVVGDAAVRIEGLDRAVAPTSTVVGAAALNAAVAEAVGRLVAAGIEPEIFASSNTSGGDAVNTRLLGAGA